MATAVYVFEITCVGLAANSVVVYDVRCVCHADLCLGRFDYRGSVHTVCRVVCCSDTRIRAVSGPSGNTGSTQLR